VANRHGDERDEEQQPGEQPARRHREGERVHPSSVPGEPSQVGDGFVPEV
jgi:hypothetical protein